MHIPNLLKKIYFVFQLKQNNNLKETEELMLKSSRKWSPLKSILLRYKVNIRRGYATCKETGWELALYLIPQLQLLLSAHKNKRKSLSIIYQLKQKYGLIQIITEIKEQNSICLNIIVEYKTLILHSFIMSRINSINNMINPFSIIWRGICHYLFFYR